MLRDYVEQLYEPTAAHTDVLTADENARARALAAWKARVAKAWPTVAVREIDAPDGIAELGATRTVTAIVAMGGLNQDDIAVQLLHGAVGPNDELIEPTFAEMSFVDIAADKGSFRYEGTFEASRAGRYGFTVRVVPSHPDLVTYAELGCAALPA
jgi:starch phosphorylase